MGEIKINECAGNRSKEAPHRSEGLQVSEIGDEEADRDDDAGYI